MKALRHWTPHYNLDMTECRLNVVMDTDGKPHIMASFPKKWEFPPEEEVPRLEGTRFKLFKVTEWEEVELEVKSKS